MHFVLDDEHELLTAPLMLCRPLAKYIDNRGKIAGATSGMKDTVLDPAAPPAHIVVVVVLNSFERDILKRRLS